MPNDNTHTQRELTIRDVFRVSDEIRAEGLSDTLHLEEMESRLLELSRTPAEPKAGDWEKELERESRTRQEVAKSAISPWFVPTGKAKQILRRALSSAAPRITEE